jgi:hypothetical protein
MAKLASSLQRIISDKSFPDEVKKIAANYVPQALDETLYR